MVNPRKKIILIADGEDDWRDLLATVVRRSGYEVMEVKTGQDAIDQTALRNPSLILLDVGLPGLDGREALTRLMTNPVTRDIPVFLQVAGARAQGIRIFEGAKEILYKPFDLGDLPALLRKYLPEEAAKTPPTSVKD